MENPETNTDEVLIRQAMKEVSDAIRARDFDRIYAHYDNNVETFDPGPPSRTSGLAAVRKGNEEWLSAFEEPITHEQEQFKIMVDGEVAFAYGFTHMAAKRGGEDMDMWVRSTYGLVKTDGKWLVVHEHTSMPFDMETFQPIMQIQN